MALILKCSRLADPIARILAKDGPRYAWPLVSTASRCWMSTTSEACGQAVTLSNKWDGLRKPLILSYPASYHNKSAAYSLDIPHRVRQKVVTANDAISLISDFDTVCVSGFVSQGAPEAILKTLGDRYKETGGPHSLTLLFGGGPGDWENKGLNHLAGTAEDLKNEENQPGMLRRTIGSHYGQVPAVAQLAVSNDVEAWALPLGSISRMIRSQATHSPGHLTTIGLGTLADPEVGNGCAANQAATKSDLDVVSKVNLDGQDLLMYKALPIHAAIIRATTGDTQGNLSLEEESLLCDQRNIAVAAKNSGGIVIAQVKRLAAAGSLPSRKVDIPAPLVDCVVVVDEEDHDTLHPMSYDVRYDPVLTGEIKMPEGRFEPMPLSQRKIIARRAAMALRPGNVVNLGIGMPEGVAPVAAEEGMLKDVTLTTEPGAFGGIPASGRSFGPSKNADALIEMNQMFDFYDGGGLDMAFLGAAEISANGDVNVSRLSEERLTGPGGFVDISQSTRNICFMSPFTCKGLNVNTDESGKLQIVQEGKLKKFVSRVKERTFSGDEAVRRGQRVYYVTERAVFQKSAKHDVIELIEIAPGVDVAKDILDQMEFSPAISPHLKLMDPRIFQDQPMNLRTTMFGSLDERCIYHEADHTVFLDLYGITLSTPKDVTWFFDGVEEILYPIVRDKGPVNAVLNYTGFDLEPGLEEQYMQRVDSLKKNFYRSSKRYSEGAFRRAELAKRLNVTEWDPDTMFAEFDQDQSGTISVAELRQGMKTRFGIHLTQTDVNKFISDSDPNLSTITKESFDDAIFDLLKKGRHSPFSTGHKESASLEVDPTVFDPIAA